MSPPTQNSDPVARRDPPTAASPATEPFGSRVTVAVAGASGFVGRHLVDRLCAEHDVIALGRTVSTGELWRGTDAKGRQCDLFSLDDAERALRGVDVAYYLVHSMMPNARLTQSKFEDMDAILADNFGRAAARAGVQRIIYLGGLIPEVPDLSKHLESRQEVELLLGAHGVPVTVLRAGLVVGKGGSSLQILTRLVGRLPAMVCPRWTESRTQPVSLADVVEMLARCAVHDSVVGRTFDIGGPDVLTYREMIARTAQVMGVERKLIGVGVFTPGLSTLWVSLVTGSPRALVGPLVQSLRHPMVARDDELAQLFGMNMVGFDQALSAALLADGSEPEAEVATAESHALTAQRSPRAAATRSRPDVRSIQRFALPSPRSATSIMHAYLEWLPRFCRPFVRVGVDDAGVCRFEITGTRLCLLELAYSHTRSTPDRALLYITNGVLAEVREGDRDRLEFRILPGGREVLAAIHDFTPALPWFVYKITQAPAHLAVMRAFARHLYRSETRTGRQLLGK